jgi:hypothetical protein
MKVGDRIIYDLNDGDSDGFTPRRGKGVITKISDIVFEGGYYIRYDNGGMWCILDELELDHQYYREQKLKKILK